MSTQTVNRKTVTEPESIAIWSEVIGKPTLDKDTTNFFRHVLYNYATPPIKDTPVKKTIHIIGKLIDILTSCGIVRKTDTELLNSWEFTKDGITYLGWDTIEQYLFNHGWKISFHWGDRKNARFIYPYIKIAMLLDGKEIMSKTSRIEYIEYDYACEVYFSNDEDFKNTVVDGKTMYKNWYYRRTMELQ